ncbi:MAG: transposase family protein, partial [bacterium]|nr:transposase family protein [bacterium]
TGLHVPHKSSKHHPLTKQQHGENLKHARVRILVEHVFASLKQFRILAHRFRSTLSDYNDIFKTVVGLYNLRHA